MPDQRYPADQDRDDRLVRVPRNRGREVIHLLLSQVIRQMCVVDEVEAIQRRATIDATKGWHRTTLTWKSQV